MKPVEGSRREQRSLNLLLIIFDNDNGVRNSELILIVKGHHSVGRCCWGGEGLNTRLGCRTLGAGCEFHRERFETGASATITQPYPWELVVQFTRHRIHKHVPRSLPPSGLLGVEGLPAPEAEQVYVGETSRWLMPTRPPEEAVSMFKTKKLRRRTSYTWNSVY